MSRWIPLGAGLCLGWLLAACSTSDLRQLADAMTTDRIDPAATAGQGGDAHPAATRLAFAPLLEDAEAQRFINALGRWLTLQDADTKAQVRWRFGITDADELDAFASADGVVLVSRGMLQLLETEDEVAAVLAQQISLGRQAATRPLRTGLAALPQVQAPDQYAAGVHRADTEAMQTIARSGYDPYAMISVLTMLTTLNPADPRVASLLDAGPAPSERLRQLRRNLPPGLDGQVSMLRDTQRWPRIRARLLQASE